MLRRCRKSLSSTAHCSQFPRQRHLSSIPGQHKPSLLLRAVKGLAKGTAACGVTTLVAYKTGALGWVDEGTERSLRFWSAAFPIYLQYESVQQRYKHGWISYEESLEMYEALHNRYTDYVRELTYEMRGFYLKNAQVMSTYSDLTPNSTQIRY